MVSRVGGAGVPGTAQLPQIAQRQQSEDAEEDSRNLQPQHSREPHERPPNRLAEAFAPASQSLLRSARLRDRPDSGMGRLPGRRIGRHSSRRACWLHTGSRRGRLDSRGRPTRFYALAGRILRRRRVHRGQQRLHRLPRPESERTSKTNPIHARSVAFITQCARVRFIQIQCLPGVASPIQPHLHPILQVNIVPTEK